MNVQTEYGLSIDLPDNRSVSVYIFQDGGCGLVFTRDGIRTEVCMSRAARSALTNLLIQANWRGLAPVAVEGDI